MRRLIPSVDRPGESTGQRDTTLGCADTNRGQQVNLAWNTTPIALDTAQSGLLCGKEAEQDQPRGYRSSGFRQSAVGGFSRHEVRLVHLGDAIHRIVNRNMHHRQRPHGLGWSGAVVLDGEQSRLIPIGHDISVSEAGCGKQS